MDLTLIIIISYIIGSIPFGFILTKLFLKKDIRKLGSGNIGATNALRTGNKFIGYGTLFFDVTKAVIPILFIKYNFADYIYIASLSVFLGHVFPVWLKFKGGKGVAPYLGILFSLNYVLGFLFILSWIIVILLTKYSSLSSLSSSLVIAVYNYFLANNENYYFYIIMFILIFYTHRENIKRLINNTESKIKFN